MERLATPDRVRRQRFFSAEASELDKHYFDKSPREKDSAPLGLSRYYERIIRSMFAAVEFSAGRGTRNGMETGTEGHENAPSGIPRTETGRIYDRADDTRSMIIDTSHVDAHRVRVQLSRDNFFRNDVTRLFHLGTVSLRTESSDCCNERGEFSIDCLPRAPFSKSIFTRSFDEILDSRCPITTCVTHVETKVRSSFRRLSFASRKIPSDKFFR